MKTLTLRSGFDPGSEVKTFPVFDIPGLLSPCFTGRDSFLGHLHENLKPGTHSTPFRRAAIYGLPGAGKTQLALKYASRYRENYSAVFFVSAASMPNFIQGYGRILSLLDIPEKSQSEWEIKAAAARAWFENSRSNDGRGWLLIVDNISPDVVEKDNPADDKNATVTNLISKYLPRAEVGPEGSILFTTRKPQAAAIVVGRDAKLCVHLPKMDENEAIDLLLRESGKDGDDQSANAIARELGHLPLAISQAGTYIREMDVTFEQYLDDFRKTKGDALEWTAEDDPQLMSSTTKTFHLAFEGMAQRFPISADIFRLFAFLHPEEIPIEILTEGAQNIAANTKLSEIVKSQIRLSHAINGMLSGSLAQRLGDSAAKKFWIHDLVQYLFRQWMTSDERLEWAERAIDVINSVYPRELGSLETWQTAKIYLKHGLSCAEHVENLGIQTANLCDLMIRMSWFLRQTGDLTAAAGFATRAVSCAKFLGEGTRRHMDSLSNLGLINYHLSRFEQAGKQLTEAVQIAKSILGPAYLDTGIGNILTLILYQQGRFRDAEGHHQAIYSRRKEVLGESHPETLGAMGSLANTYHFQGFLKTAVFWKKKVLEGRREHMGEDHPETLGAQGSLATTYSDQGLHKEAEQLQRAVMVGRHVQWGSENPEYLSAKAALSYTLYLQGHFKEAERDQKEVLDVRLKLFGENHIETIGAMRFLAKTYYAQTLFDKAAELQEKVVFQIEKLLGKDHHETLTARDEISITYNSQGLHESARNLHEEVLTRTVLWGTEGMQSLRSLESWSRKHQGFAH